MTKCKKNNSDEVDNGLGISKQCTYCGKLLHATSISALGHYRDKTMHTRCKLKDKAIARRTAQDAEHPPEKPCGACGKPLKRRKNEDIYTWKNRRAHPGKCTAKLKRIGGYSASTNETPDPKLLQWGGGPMTGPLGFFR